MRPAQSMTCQKRLLENPGSVGLVSGYYALSVYYLCALQRHKKLLSLFACAKTTTPLPSENRTAFEQYCILIWISILE